MRRSPRSSTRPPLAQRLLPFRAVRRRDVDSARATGPHGGQHQGGASTRERMRDPQFRAAFARVVCGKGVTLPRSRTASRRTCGDRTCRRELRRRTATDHAVRRRQIIDRLRALPPDAFAALPDREREIVRLSYGLDDGIPRSTAALAERLGCSAWQVRQSRERAVARLLGGPPAEV